MASFNETAPLFGETLYIPTQEPPPPINPSWPPITADEWWRDREPSYQVHGNRINVLPNERGTIYDLKQKIALLELEIIILKGRKNWYDVE